MVTLCLKTFLPHDAKYKRGRCCRAVSFVSLSRSCILSKRIDTSSKFFTVGLPHHSSFFHTNRYGNISTGTLLTAGVECRWGRQKSRLSTEIWLWHRPLLDRRASSTFRRWSIWYITYASSVSRCQQTPPHHASVNLGLDVTPKRTKQNLIVRIGKYKAEVTNIKSLRSRLNITIETNYWEAWSIMRPLCDSRATG